MSINQSMYLAGLALVYLTCVNAQTPIPTGYQLDITFQPRERMMKGFAEVFFKSAEVKPRTLAFYLHGELDVDSVMIGTAHVSHKGKKIFYYYDYSLAANSVQVDLPTDTLTSMRIYYSGYFSPSRARSPSDYMRIDEDGVFLRGYGYSLWFPTFVNSGEPPYSPTFHRVRIHTPREYHSVFVGTKVSDFEDGENRTTEWSAPSLSVIDVQLTAQKYQVTQSGNYLLYALKESASQSQGLSVLGFTKRLDSLYALRFGTTSTERQLFVLQMPEYGDIASGNVVGISSATWRDFSPGSDAGLTLAHELVHSYVQVPTPMSDSMYALIIEGFPSYFHYPVLAEILGEEFYRQVMTSVEKSYLQRKATGKNRRGEKLPVEKPILEIGAKEIGAYKDVYILNDRVRLFFDYTRRQLGLEKFWSLVRELVNVDTLSYDACERIYLRYFPDGKEDLRVWLKTNEYPERFRLNKKP